jgi:hypothetical protein
MRGYSTTKVRAAKTDAKGSRRRGARPRWYRVRVETEGGAYLGSLRIDSAGLRQVVDDERTYLPLWNAAREGSPAVEEFLALHKAAIRSVVVVSDDHRAGREAQEA